jgi:transcription initiation factor IIE alpha subunit
MNIDLKKSRAKGNLACSCCTKRISADEFNANGGYCDECRDDRGNSVVEYVKNGGWDKDGRKDEDLLRRT